MALVPFVMEKVSLTVHDSYCFKDLNVRCKGESWVLLLSLGQNHEERERCKILCVPLALMIYKSGNFFILGRCQSCITYRLN